VKGLSFTRGVVFALGFAFLSSVAFTLVGPGMPHHALVWLLVPSLCFAYLLSIGQHRYRKAGWASSLVLWCAFALLLWVVSPSLTDYLLLHVAALSSMRGLFFHKNLLSVLMDFALSLLALGTSFWAASHTGSVFLSVWCFFLVQAAFVAIPGCRTATSTRSGTASNSQQFDLALRKAEEALRLIAIK
jgi:hypothetical protein